MTQKQKIVFSEGLLALAYAYTLSGYQAASVAVGSLAMILMVSFHSIASLKRQYVKILALTIGEILLIQIFQLQKIAPCISFLAFANAVLSFVSMESSHKVVYETIKMVIPVMLTFMVIVFSLPGSILKYFIASASEGFLEMFILICLIFTPILIAYIENSLETEWRNK
ncbi:MAG: hypothetical protein J6D29_03215 [Solobacterium sp.]|nr:hypothetical protein [Solobacterium sp.]